MPLILLINFLALVLFPGHGIGVVMGIFVYLLGLGTHTVKIIRNEYDRTDESILILTTFSLILNVTIMVL